MEFNYFLPVNIVFGSGKVLETGELTKPYGKKALIVTGKSSMIKKIKSARRLQEKRKRSLIRLLTIIRCFNIFLINIINFAVSRVRQSQEEKLCI